MPPFPSARIAGADRPFARRVALSILLGGPALLAGCGGGGDAGMPPGMGANGLYPNETPQLRRLINRHADRMDVPRSLVQRIIIRESSHRPDARNGPHYGLMQIRHDTARTMGYRGPAGGLYDPETNLRYGIRYLRGAWILSDGSQDRAIGWYSRGYYYEAKRRGLLRETGLRS